MVVSDGGSVVWCGLVYLFETWRTSAPLSYTEFANMNAVGWAVYFPISMVQNVLSKLSFVDDADVTHDLLRTSIPIV